MRIPLGPVAVRGALGVAVAGYALVGVFSLTGHAGQARSVADGVYSAEQAQRGQQLYQAQCVACHGDKLQGLIGPMLTGEAFVSAWGGRSAAVLVDKIQNTMPLGAPGSLMRPQAIDIAAYILQGGSFKPGQTALADAALRQVTFPASRPAAAPAAGGGVALAPTANLAQLMRGVTFPNANIFFNAQLKDPGAEKPKAPVPFDYVLWGQTVYYGWQSVDQAALALQETTPLFLLPGRRCENGRPVPVGNATYQRTTQALVDLSRELYKVAQSRNHEALAGMAERLNEACDACHRIYRDVSTSGKSVSEGGVSADRCRQVP
ncbi:MAG: c-type cytochrome [Acidobacteria bacterium]|nr:c-type cytochrome [Acidobacteriota bacterium]